MMKPYELQIGDYVCYDKPNGYITRVDAIRRFGLAVAREISGIRKKE